MSGRALLAVAPLILVTLPAMAKDPVLGPLFPAGAARGQTLNLTVSGTLDRWPVRSWADSPALVIRPQKEKGKLTIVVARDAEPGLHWLRLTDAEGASNLRPFAVGTLPEVTEAEPNDDPERPHRLEGSATVNGRLGKKGDVDGFSLPLRKGQVLVADLEANRHFGSPMDAVLQVVSAEGFVLDQNDDAIGRDPRIAFEAPADGVYIVRLFAFPATPDSTIAFAGGDAYIYRLTLTTGGFVDYAFPLAVSTPNPAHVEAIGSSIPAAARFLSVADGQGAAMLSHPLLANTAEVRRVPYATSVEFEPNDAAHPQPVATPVAVSGRIDPPGDRDHFHLRLKRGVNHTLRVESRTLGLPPDPVLRLTDAAGKVVAESDDSGKTPDPELSFAPPDDGDYVAAVRDLNGRGGPNFAYLFSVLVPDPDFGLSLAADHFELTPGKTASVTVIVNRTDGFAEPIEVVAEGLPEGITATPITSKPGDASAKSVTLQLKADECACPGPFRVVGKARQRSRVARASIAGFGAKTDAPWLTIKAAK